jgi:rhodanese-related sulfurtransferase
MTAGSAFTQGVTIHMKPNHTIAVALILACASAGAAETATQALPAACGKPPSAAQLAQIQHTSRELSRPEIDALLADPAHVVFIDVRRPDEVTTCGGFPVYLSIQVKDLEASLGFIPRDRHIVTVSNHAVRAWRSADLLAGKGFDVVGAVSAEDYAAAGGTLTRITPPPPRPASAEAGQGAAQVASGPTAAGVATGAPATR